MWQVILMNDEEMMNASLHMESSSKEIVELLFDVGKLIPADKSDEWCNIAAEIIDYCTDIQKISSKIYCTDYWYGDEESEILEEIGSIEEGL